MLSGDDLAIVLFLAGIAISFALAAMTTAGWRHPILIRGLFGLAGICFVGAVAWPWVKSISPIVTSIITHLATNPVSWFVVFMFLVATVLLPGKIKTSNNLPQSAASIDFVTNIFISTSLPDAPALFGGTASTNLERVKIFLDYSVYFTSLGHAGWSQRRRIEIAAFEPFEKDIRYEAAVVSRTVDANGKIVALKWGNELGNKDIIGGEKCRARLAFVTQGKEQYFYFMLVPCCKPDGCMDVTILSQNDFSFRQEWEET
jgi:uncharacterized membrane protein